MGLPASGTVDQVWRESDPVEWCGRFWYRSTGKKDYYRLIKANNLLMKLVESLLDLVGKIAQQMCAARFEFRDDPYCLRGFY